MSDAIPVKIDEVLMFCKLAESNTGGESFIGLSIAPHSCMCSFAPLKCRGQNQIVIIHSHTGSDFLGARCGILIIASTNIPVTNDLPLDFFFFFSFLLFLHVAYMPH